MTNTIPNVPRELLERLLDNPHTFRRLIVSNDELRALLSAPSPAGVDGLEVVGLSERIRPGVEAAPWVCDEVKKLEAIIDGLRGEVYDEEKERALFEAAFGALHLSGQYDSWIGRWKFTEYHVDSLWFGWISCAKSRALSAGKEGE